MTSYPVITKADGSQEPFNPDRLIGSLRHAGAGEHTARQIAENITGFITPGMLSREIYKRAFALLRRESRPVAARYTLRRALFELGPTGHPFEDFIAHLYKAMGWKVETRKIIQGHCVPHEVDFYASNPEQTTFLAAELKYHNQFNYKTDLKVALYVKSRFDDIFSCNPEVRNCPIDRGLLVTNTKFTGEAIAYAECAGVELLGWGYPHNASLPILMSRARIYPITILTHLSRGQKNILIENGTIAIDQIMHERERLDVLHLSAEKVGVLLAEADAILSLPEMKHGSLEE